MSLNTPLVSVIIPVYNGAGFIQKGYEQIAAQDYPNLEIIFVDNNSTDKTVALIEELKDKDPTIRLLFESKQGAGAARNKGIREARGQFLSFLDIDDQIIVDKISRQIKILQEEPGTGLVFGKQEKVFLHKKGKNYTLAKHIAPGIHMPYKLGILWMQNFGLLVNPSSVTCRKSVALAIGGFQEELLTGEDATFMIKAAFNFPVHHDGVITSTYIRHPDSTISIDNKSNKTVSRSYISYKTFYLDYIYKISEKVKDKNLRKIIDNIIISNLNKHLHLGHRSLSDRYTLLKSELQELKDKSFPVSKYFPLLLALALLPDKAAQMLLKSRLKIIKIGDKLAFYPNY